jgi:glycosyltransferase involved in cell wall biosynthesis
MRPWVEEKIRELELTEVVHVLGRYPAESMPRYFSLAHALLVTLKRDPIFSLTIPAKVQSYLACGIPVIAGLDGEGARIISEAGAGITCPAESPEGLADAVLSMYRMTDEERKNMGLQGRRYFEKHFERAALLDQLDEWIKKLKEETNTCAY